MLAEVILGKQALAEPYRSDLLDDEKLIFLYLTASYRSFLVGVKNSLLDTSEGIKLYLKCMRAPIQIGMVPTGVV
jgi:hypothetical protein